MGIPSRRTFRHSQLGDFDEDLVMLIFKIFYIVQVMHRPVIPLKHGQYLAILNI